jgi:hypothetical protein
MRALGSPGMTYRKMLAANSTNATLGTVPRVPTTTLPALAIDFRDRPPSWVKLVPFGTDANNETFTARLWGWQLVGTLWVPTILVQFLATMGNVNGVAGTDVLNTDFFCDTLGDPTAGFGTKGYDCQPHSPANDTPGFYEVKAQGCQLFELETAVGTGASGNALIGIM